MTFRNDILVSDVEAVTPSDDTAVDYVGLFIGTGGDVAIKGEGDTAVTLTNVPDGTLLRGIHVLAVMETDTTASEIVGLKA